MEDRAKSVCDLLMGAAFADKELHEGERKTVGTTWLRMSIRWPLPWR
ncbi:MAG: hypothetical protein GY811_07560 [Myxococcales bacterium]|nr:hypothetical protein [Myxococcales bacterium]